MAVFAYNINNSENTGNPIEFLSRKNICKNEISSVYDRTKFLLEYVLESNIQFVIFGDECLLIQVFSLL